MQHGWSHARRHRSTQHQATITNAMAGEIWDEGRWQGRVFVSRNRSGRVRTPTVQQTPMVTVVAWNQLLLCWHARSACAGGGGLPPAVPSRARLVQRKGDTVKHVVPEVACCP